jgi:hypothetical protein
MNKRRRYKQKQRAAARKKVNRVLRWLNAKRNDQHSGR